MYWADKSKLMWAARKEVGNSKRQTGLIAEITRSTPDRAKVRGGNDDRRGWVWLGVGCWTGETMTGRREDEVARTRACVRWCAVIPGRGLLASPN